MAKITRKELKTDKFALEVEQTVDFFEEHQQQLLRYGGIALAVILLLVGYVFYSRHQQAKREAALYQAIQIEEAPVGPPAPGGPNRNFPTQEAKDQVALKTFSDLLTAYPGSSEGEIAQYYIASIYADQGKLADAEKNFKQVADNASAQYSSLAKLSLAQIYFADGRSSQGEAVLRSLIDHPTIFVSKDQATMALAKHLAATNPNEARKLIAPLRSVPGPVGQAAMSLDTELPPQ